MSSRSNKNGGSEDGSGGGNGGGGSGSGGSGATNNSTGRRSSQLASLFDHPTSTPPVLESQRSAPVAIPMPIDQKEEQDSQSTPSTQPSTTMQPVFHPPPSSSPPPPPPPPPNQPPPSTPSSPPSGAIMQNETHHSTPSVPTGSSSPITPTPLTNLFSPPNNNTKGPTVESIAASMESISNERTSLLSSSNNKGQQHVDNDHHDLSNLPSVPRTSMGGDDGTFHRMKQGRLQDSISSMDQKDSWWIRFLKHPLVNEILQPTTFIGAFMFLMYHVVFVLAFGSAIMRPHADNGGSSILGVMAKWTTVGIVTAGPIYVARLNPDIPAIDPSVDLFLAPFFAQAATVIDESLWEQSKEQGMDGQYSDAVFFGSFATLTTLGMLLAGSFLWMGATFKLANLGSYLPYSVLSGFFSAVGVLLWCLAFTVDANGQTWKQVFFSGDWSLIGTSVLHHVPSLAMGIIMNQLGPKNPFFVIMLILITIVLVYLSLWVTGQSLHDAQQAGWFWSLDELVYDHREGSSDVQEGLFGIHVPSWTLPPTPFGTFAAILAGHVNYRAVSAGLGNITALAFLYLLRSSIHASALKKNVNNLVRRVPKKEGNDMETTTTKINNINDNNNTTNGTRVNIDLDQDLDDVNATINAGNKASQQQNRPRASVLQRMKESVRIVNMSMEDRKPIHYVQSHHSSPLHGDDGPGYTEIRPKATHRTLESIFCEYAYTLFAVAIAGGFGVCPNVATSNIMFAIGGDSAPPQYGSILLLIFFYFLDFRMVEYIPKTAFSSLLVLGAVNNLVVWFYGAFRKTQDLAEWLVVPLIAGCSLFVGFLNAVFLGIAISMFVFVASFLRVGVVKYYATGLEIRSRIERSMAESAWLNDNGDACQVLVLQNYLFFGNAYSILSYIMTMFEDVDEIQSQQLGFSLPPIPKILVLDMSLVSGMDTATTDIFAEMYQFCQNNDCKLFLSGLSSRMKKALELGGVKPDRGGPRSRSNLRFFGDLDSALGRAEDMLIQHQMTEPPPPPQDSNKTPRRMVSSKSADSPDDVVEGFRKALKQIDDLHGLSSARTLLDLQSYTETIDLKAGECLYKCDGGMVEEARRGLFFIEEGTLKIERDTSHSLTWTRSSIGAGSSQYTLKNQHARMGSVARRGAMARGGKTNSSNLRLARLGPGWIAGTLDLGTGIRSSGITIAVTHCRLHLLPFSVVQQLEKDDPALALALYKLVTHLRAHREEATIEQLTTLNNILTTPAHLKPVNRSALRAMGP